MSSVLFVLPVGGGSGGAHSVMQEADAMRKLGVNAMIAANQENAPRLRRSYRDLQTIGSHVHGYQGAEGLGQLIASLRPDVTVATTNQSVHTISDALKAANIKGARTAYYIQDYEPLFYDKGDNTWHIAYTSYGLIPGMLHFAKTRWLQEVVEDNHRVQVHKVEPSIDHAVYYPNLGAREELGDTLRVSAMLRPATPRRAPRRTVRIMNRIAAEFGARVRCSTFGCTEDELKQHSLRLTHVEHSGVLAREEVGEHFRTIDLFIDMSDFQAFGRTAIEAMSCGAVAIVPAHGGAYEYAQDGKNCFLVDTRNDEAIFTAVKQFVSMSAEERREMRMQGIRSGYSYSPEAAALSEIMVLGL